MHENNESPKESGDGLLGKARRLADEALAYARSDEAKAKMAAARKKAVEVGGAASAGARDVLDTTGRAAARAKVKIDEIANSERAGQIRSGAGGLWERSKSITVRGVPWMESPLAIGILLVLIFPLGLWLVWRHPVWSKGRKMVWVGAWAGLLVVGLAVRGQETASARRTFDEAGTKIVTKTQTRRASEIRANGAIQQAVASKTNAEKAVGQAQEELTGDFLPHQPGLVKTYILEEFLSDRFGLKTWNEESHKEGGVIEVVTVAKHSISGPDGEKAVPGLGRENGRKITKHRRDSGGYIELKADSTESFEPLAWMNDWTPLLKSGAKEGEIWKRAYNESRTDEFLVLRFATFGSGADSRPCVVIERKVLFGDRNSQTVRCLIQYKLVKGLGVTEAITSMAVEGGDWRTTSVIKLSNWRGDNP